MTRWMETDPEAGVGPLASQSPAQLPARPRPRRPAQPVQPALPAPPGRRPVTQPPPRAPGWQDQSLGRPGRRAEPQPGIRSAGSGNRSLRPRAWRRRPAACPPLHAARAHPPPPSPAPPGPPLHPAAAPRPTPGSPVHKPRPQLPRPRPAPSLPSAAPANRGRGETGRRGCREADLANERASRAGGGAPGPCHARVRVKTGVPSAKQSFFVNRLQRRGG